MDLRSLWRRFSGRSTEPDSVDVDEPADRGADRAGADDGGAAMVSRSAVTDRPARAAWRDLPPIERTVQPPPLVARTVDFGHELSGNQAPPLALEPLGHDRLAEAPAGVVSGLFVGRHAPVEGVDGGPLRASVRAAALHHRETAAVGDSPRLAGGAEGRFGGDERAVGAGPIAAPSTIAPTHRPVVSREVASSAAPRALISAPSSPRTSAAGIIGRPQAAGPGRPQVASPLPAADTSVPARAVVAPAGAPPATVNPASGAAGDGSPGSVLHRNLGQTRRLRFGPAIDSTGRDARASLGAVEPAKGRGDPFMTPTGRGHVSDASVIGPGAIQRRIDERGGVVSRSTGEQGQTNPGFSQSGETEPPTPPAAGTPATAERPVPARPIASQPRPETAPLVGRLTVGRHAGRSPDGPAAAQPRVAGGRQPVPVDASAGRPSVQGVVDALAGRSGSAMGGVSGSGMTAFPAAVQRAAGDAAAPPPDAMSPAWSEPGGGSLSPGSAPGMASAADAAGVAIGGPAVARFVAVDGGDPSSRGTPGAGWPEPSTLLRRLSPSATSPAAASRRTGGWAGEVGPSSRSVATSQVVGAESSRGSTAQLSAASTADARAGAAWATTPETVFGSAAIQRAIVDDPGAVTEPAASTGFGATATIVSREEGGDGGGGAPAAGAAGAGSDKELDELARKLFPRLQLRLRSELLIDRERIGALVDLGR